MVPEARCLLNSYSDQKPGSEPTRTKCTGVFGDRAGWGVQVLEVKDIGAVVELPGGRDSLVHISELSMEPVEKTQDAVKVGDAVDVYILSSSANSTRASIAALERLKQGLPAAVERKRRSDGNGSTRGRGRGGGRGRGQGRGSGAGANDAMQPGTPKLPAVPLQAPPARGGQ